MELTTIKIDMAKLADYNPRKDLQPGMEEYDKIKMSIGKYGYVDPIIVNKKTGNIVGGHQRWKVLKDLGFEEIEVVYVDVNLKTEKSMNLALNKISGEWDLIKLKDLMMEFEEEDFKFTGFDEAEIEDIVGRFEVPEFTEAPDNIGEPKTITCPHCGEVIEL